MTYLPFNWDHIVRATFIERPNRFLVRCSVDEVGVIDAYLPNPGRLLELLLPGASLYIHPTGPIERNLSVQRKTRFTVLAVIREGSPIFLHTHFTNQVARYLIEKKSIPRLEGARVVRREVTLGKSRFDFLLRHKEHDIYLEVKSCTLFGNDVAMFPDAITQRGRRHLLELAKRGREGIKAAALFIVHYHNVVWFMPDFHTDYDFSTTMLEVKDDLMILPVAIEWKPDLTVGSKVKTLEIPWDYLRREVKDRGSYLLILHLERDRVIEIGRLGKLMFCKGYFLYVGSAMSNLTARIRRHCQRRKKVHWHIDYLTPHVNDIIPMTIRSSQRLECEIAESLSYIMKAGPPGFGSSDCLCQTHLFWSETNPLHTKGFHDTLQRFRMRHP